MKIQPATRLRGTIILPGDKSISHRAAILAAMATGDTRIENFATGADCASTLRCLENLGVEIRRENTTVFVKGVGKNNFQKPSKDLDCGNSGTTMRLLAGVLAGQNFDSVLTGDASLRARPMRRIIEPLTRMGARVEAEKDCAPLKIYGKNPLAAIDYELPIPSAQIKSCILLAALNASGETRLQSPKSEFRTANSRNHTELMLRFLGARVEENFDETGDEFVQKISIDGSSRLVAEDLKIPCDISSAAFFVVAAASLENSEIVLRNVGLNPTRTRIIDVLRAFGASIEVSNEREICNEIVGDLLVRGARPNASSPAQAEINKIDGETVARIIDEIPILAVFGTQIENGLEIRGARELRVKESDRIKAIVENLKKMNANVEEFTDGFRVEKSDLKGARVNSHGDHRIAMAFSIAALFASGATEIADAECAGVSFPEFFQTLERIGK